MAQPPAANALPTGGVVSAGQAAISQSGNQMQVLQGTDKAALNWQSFDIGSNAGVTFQQPSAQSVALNRVAGADPSRIFGSLTANGRLILINPNGVVFGAGSRVDAAALIATTKALSDADFMSNQYRFSGGGDGAVRNDGTIIAAPDGSILLVADTVINTGTMQVRGGSVGMVSADQLQVSGDWKTTDAISTLAAAANTVTVENFGRIDVSGAKGGWILLEGGQGTTQTDGDLLAVGQQGGGGVIHLSGVQVGLMRGSLTNASGAEGGGEVLVGGDWQGSGSMAHASATYMDADAVVQADALVQGNGGKVVLWSDGYTNFRGQIQANGAGGGNGGLVETSGKATLDAFGQVSATGTQAGSWLLDPSDVTIATAGTGGLTGNTYNPGLSGTIANGVINTALDGGTTVTISTTAGTGGNGVITQLAGADIAMTGNLNSTLILRANRIIDLFGNISATGTGQLNLDLDASGGTGLKTGAIVVRGNLSTNGGNMTFRSGVMLLGATAQTMETSGGSINFNSDVEIANPLGLTIDTVTGAANGGAVNFGGKVDSGDTYSFVAVGNWNDAYNNLQSGNGKNVGSVFLSTPRSELENSVVNYRAQFDEFIALGALGNQGDFWLWSSGPLAGQKFNGTRDSVNVLPLPNGDLSYQNWMTGEPFSPNVAQTAMGMNAAGQWVTVTGTGGGSGRFVNGTVLQTITIASPLTVNAGTGAVTFSDRVGSFKPLRSLEVTGPLAINGKQVTTELGQVYNNPITIGNVLLTLMESTMGSLVLDNPISYNQPGASTLQIVAAQNITLNAPITAINAPLAVSMTADYKGGGNGAITINDPIETRGGAITLTASTGIELDNQPLTSDGGNITLTNQLSGDISATGAATIDAGNGFIQVINGNLALGTPGQGKIVLQDLTGGNITVRNAAVGLGVGQNAVTLNRPVTAGGAVLITSLTGDILNEADILTTGGSVTIIADQNNTGLGGITINGPVSSAGGAIMLTGSSGITAAATAPLDAGTGNITVTNGLAAGNTGSNGIVLHALNGNAITVANNTIALLAGNVAVALNDPVDASGAVTVTSRTGDIVVDNTITTSGTPVLIEADTNISGAGTIMINQPMTTSNGSITLIANSGILAAAGADLDAGTGNIFATNGTGGGGTGSGVIVLQKLTAGAITVSSNPFTMPAGQVAVTIEGAVAATGLVNIVSNAGSILTQGDISTTGTSVTIQADARTTGNGAITVNRPVTTQGGRISLSASSGIVTLPGAVLNAGAGDITVTNGNLAGTAGSGQISLQDLTGGVINVSNNTTGMTSGQTAIILNGPVNGGGAVSITSQTGDILVEGDVLTTGPPVTISADTRNTGGGSIFLTGSVASGGGAITLTASSGIRSTPGANLNAGSGNLVVTNGIATGTTGNGQIVLQDLSGSAITVINNAAGRGMGQNAITLARPVIGTGAVTITSLSGDILAHDAITTTAFPVSISADTRHTGAGTVSLNGPVTTTGGAISLAASSGIVTAAGAALNAATGNILVTNGFPGGTTGSGAILLQDLTGRTITVASNVAGLGVGVNAVTLNGPVAGSGAITISSQTGDILGNAGISSTGMPVMINADQLHTGAGAVSLNAPVTSGGGAIGVSGGSGITAAPGAVFNAGTGNITVTNGVAGGATGSGAIVLRDVSGGVINVVNNAAGVIAGQNAITLAGPVAAHGATTLSARSGDIQTDGTISSNGAAVSVTADAADQGNGAIKINQAVTTGGGAVLLVAGSGIALTNAPLNANGGAGNANVTLRNNRSGNILAGPGSVINTGGNITITNGVAAGVTGGGTITLQALNGNAIEIVANVVGMAPASDAITLNGPTTSSGDIRITSQTGDIAILANVNSGAAGNPAAIIIGAGTIAAAPDSSGGNVKFIGGSRLLAQNTSRAIVYTGSIDDSTGVGPMDAAYPGPGHYRYDVSYNNTARLPTAFAGQTYVQYREQPTLTFSVLQQGKVYDGNQFDSHDWNNYNVTGWRNGDTTPDNPLAGQVTLNNNPNTVATDVGVYTFSLGSLRDTLGYKLEINGPATYTITPKLLIVGNLNAASRVYDGTTNAQITGGDLIGVEARDIGNVTVSNTIAHFLDKNVGVDKTIQVTQADLGGLRAGNYDIHFAGSTTIGTIFPAELRLSGIHPLDRVYDGTTNATFTGTPSLSGIIPGDEGAVTAPLDKISGHFADKNAGHNKEVVEDLSTAVLEGPEKGNYVLVGVDHTVNSATIFPALLQVFGTPAKKMFDGTTDSDSTAMVSGLMPGDSVGDVRQVFNNARPGKNKMMLILGGFVIDDGNDGNNYILESGGARGEITSIPMPGGIGSNGATLETKNLDLLGLLIAFDDIRQKAEQAEYFLQPGGEAKPSTTHAGFSAVIDADP